MSKKLLTTDQRNGRLLSKGVTEYESDGETENIVLVNGKSYSLKNDNNGTKRMKRLLVTQLLNNLITE